MKYKVGDKVVLLPNCVDFSIHENKVGRVDTVVRILSTNLYELKSGYQVRGMHIRPVTKLDEALK